MGFSIHSVDDFFVVVEISAIVVGIVGIMVFNG
jgi:hypothetical protein